MKSEINESTLASIRNPAFRTYAGRYVDIYKKFMQQVSQTGLETGADFGEAEFQARLEELRKKGAVVRNDAKSVYSRRISPACVACQTGIGSTTYFISLKCHRDCFFCFNPNQEGYQHFTDHPRDLVAELNSLQAAGKKVRHLGLTGGEPLLYKEDTIRFFQEARRLFPDVFTRLYTSGDHLERQTLQSLKDARMDEIRFSIRLDDPANGIEHTYRQIELAREYIPNVMVEMPVLPGRLEEMQAVLKELDRLDVFGINLLEFCFPYNNAEIFRQRGYRIKGRPYRVLYDYWYAGGLPVAGSEQDCLDLIEYALDNQLNLGVHYCSLENKHSGQVYQQNAFHTPSRTLFQSNRDYFLKSAKVFGADIPLVEDHFRKNGLDSFNVNREYDYLEFPVTQIKALKKFDIEVGISSSVFELRDGERCLRELKVELTTPKTFRQSTDI